MLDQKERITQEFITKLRDLFSEYDANLTAADHYKGYPECGEDIRMTLNIPARYDEEGNETAPDINIDLGTYFEA